MVYFHCMYQSLNASVFVCLPQLLLLLFLEKWQVLLAQFLMLNQLCSQFWKQEACAQQCQSEVCIQETLPYTAEQLHNSLDHQEKFLPLPYSLDKCFSHLNCGHSRESVVLVKVKIDHSKHERKKNVDKAHKIKKRCRHGTVDMRKEIMQTKLFRYERIANKYRQSTLEMSEKKIYTKRMRERKIQRRHF